MLLKHDRIALQLPLEPEIILYLLEHLAPAHCRRIAFSASVDLDQSFMQVSQERGLKISTANRSGLGLEKVDGLFLASHDIPTELHDLIAPLHTLAPGGLALIELSQSQSNLSANIVRVLNEIGLRILFQGPIREVPGLVNPAIGEHAGTPILVLEKLLTGGQHAEHAQVSVLLTGPDHKIGLALWNDFILQHALLDKIEIVYISKDEVVPDVARGLSLQTVPITRDASIAELVYIALANAEARFILWCENPALIPPDVYYQFLLESHKQAPAREKALLIQGNAISSNLKSGKRIQADVGSICWFNRRAAGLLFESLRQGKIERWSTDIVGQLKTLVKKDRGSMFDCVIRAFPLQ